MPKKIDPTFYFIGNHPVLDFINTKFSVNGEPLDLLKQFSDLLEWLGKAKYISQEEAVQYEQRWGKSGSVEEVMEEVRKLRSHLFDMLERSRHGEEIPSEYFDSINRFLQDQVVTTKLILKDHQFIEEKWVKVEKPLDLLRFIAEAAVDFFSNYTVKLVKKCENPDCVLRFYDNSKNSTRRWCSQKTCGNRMKVKAYLERHKKS